MTTHRLPLLLGVLGALGVPGASSQAADPKRPNILLIMADDMGFSDITPYGGEIHTPNLDALAKQGLRFTQFYNTARCCPTRAALLTGHDSHLAGVGHMVNHRDLPGYLGYLNDSSVTIAEALRPAGYHTAMAGKWHVGEDRPHWPVDRGFEHYTGLISGSCNYFDIGPKTFAIDGQKTVPGEPGTFYLTDVFADAAVKYIHDLSHSPDGKPFFLYMAFTSPHWPLHALEPDIARYRGKYKNVGWDQLREQRHQRQIQLGIVDANWPLTPRDPKAPAWDSLSEEQKIDRDQRMAVYAAQIDHMDQRIGDIPRALKDGGADQNTLILFLSDNGGCAEEIHQGDKTAPIGTMKSYESYGLPWANASNTPFRLYKHWVHEGGISTPLIAVWPGVITPAKPGDSSLGRMTSALGHVTDLLPTILDAAGAQYPTTYNGHPITPVTGQSLVPALKTAEGSAPPPHKPIFWEHEGNRALRDGQWKLVSRHKGGAEGKDEWELYDMTADRTEMHNLADQHPDKVKEMAAMWNDLARQYNVLPWDEVTAHDAKVAEKTKSGKKGKNKKKKDATE